MRTGGCQCGAVRYEAAGEPVALYACHCRECRRQSGSAFGLSLEVPLSGFRVTRGTPRFWERRTDSGGVLRCAFCPQCGTRVWHQPAGDPETITLKAGTLDEDVDLSRAIHIWISRRLPGATVPPDAPQFPEEPTAPSGGGRRR